MTFRATPLRHRRIRRRAGPVARALAVPGRHSLLVYLVHQPVLISLVWLATLV